MTLIRNIRRIIAFVLVMVVLFSISVLFASAGDITKTSTIQSEGKLFKISAITKFTSVTDDWLDYDKVTNSIAVKRTQLRVQQTGTYFSVGTHSIDRGSVKNSGASIWRDIKCTVNFHVGGENAVHHARSSTNRHNIVR